MARLDAVRKRAGPLHGACHLSGHSVKVGHATALEWGGRDPDRRPPADQDECSSEPFPCGRDARCTNTPGGFRCECPEHLAGDPLVLCSCECGVTIASRASRPIRHECAQSSTTRTIE